MTIEIHEQPDFVEFRVFGSVTSEEIIETSWAYHRKSPRQFCMWDFRQAHVSGFRAEKFCDLATLGAEIATCRGDGARNAILMRSRAEITLASAFSGMANTLTAVENESFLDRDEAVAWLTGRSAE